MIAERLSAQLLSGRRPRDPVAVAERLLAVQGQDARGVRLAIRARSSGVTAADVDRALTEDRSLLITWLNRFTLHLVRSEDYPWLHAVTTPPLFTPVMRRLGQEGVSPSAADRAVDAIVEAVAEDGPQTRAQLRDRVDAIGVVTAGQAMIHLLALASLRGQIVRGPMLGRQHAYVLVSNWLAPRPAPVDRDRGLAELARRYLIGHAPADAHDLAKWSGLPLRDARAGLGAIASELHERPDGLLELTRARRRTRPELPPPRLLGSFDPVLCGWRSREFVVGEHQTQIMVGGLFKAFAMVDGQAAGLWRIERGRVTLEPFGALAASDRAALESDGADVLRYLGVGSNRGPAQAVSATRGS